VAPLPPALLAMVTLLQAYDQVGDAEAVVTAQVDQLAAFEVLQHAMPVCILLDGPAALSDLSSCSRCPGTARWTPTM
jgi:hypothetical protein